MTAVPLILFTLGVRRIPLSTAGLLQYIAPTCTFLLAVLLYGGLIFGLVPGEEGVSWQGHLFGFIAGAMAAKALSRDPRRSRREQIV